MSYKRRTASERRFSAELRQHQFFHRVIEQPPTGPNAGVAIIAEELSQETAAGVRAVGNANARRPCFVISAGHGGRNALVAGHHQARRRHSYGIAIGGVDPEISLA